jgi:hypothetical protein
VTEIQNTPGSDHGSIATQSTPQTHQVHYIVGIANINTLLRAISQPMQWVEELAWRTGEKQRKFFRIYYAAGGWKTRCKVIAKLEVTAQGANP